MNLHFRYILFISMVVIGCTGCAWSSPWRREVGRIPGPRAPEFPIVSVEAVIQAKQPIAVVVNTYGSSSCIQPDGARVILEGMLATITPYDLRQRGGFCTLDIKAHARSVEVMFPEPGPATIRIEARDFGGQPITVEQIVLVSP